MHEHHEVIRTAADYTASSASLFVIVSHYAELATPIVTLLVGVLTAAWWALRFYQSFRKKD